MTPPRKMLDELEVFRPTRLDPAGPSAAIAHAFGRPLVEVQRDWRTYLTRLAHGRRRLHSEDFSLVSMPPPDVFEVTHGIRPDSCTTSADAGYKC